MTAAGTMPVIDRAWRADAAATSLERWLGVREQEGWGEVPADLDMLSRVFGASWYFTRFMFYAGPRAAELVDRPVPVDQTVPALIGDLRRAAVPDTDDVEDALDRLRLARNEFMLSALVRWLGGTLAAEALEAALTRLAEAVLQVSLELSGLTPRKLGVDFAVLGMGRLAGREMTFGSDLDLIFLLPGDGSGEAVEVARRSRRFLRHIAAAAPLGALYEVDMRLRPHGTAGALVTSVESFLEYHQSQRDTWERQMMTRCRPVFDPAGMGAAALDAIRPGLYAPRDAAVLRADILDMRLRVERELGRRTGRVELKRGRGGIMDVDFVCHYLQLAHGADRPDLQTCSTREVLRAAVGGGLLDPDTAADLSRGYEYLRRAETCLRLFDLKNVSGFAVDGADCQALARAMTPPGAGVTPFPDALRAVMDALRVILLRVLQPAA